MASLRFFLAALAALFLLLGFTLGFPFVFDDLSQILNNPAVHDLGRVQQLKLWLNPLRRPIAEFTFNLNYQLGGEQPHGYRLVNWFIHAANATLLFALLRQLLPSSSAVWYRGLAFWVAAIFLIHPISTQVSVYLVQRMTSLSLLFYLATLLAYLQFRKQTFLWSLSSGLWLFVVLVFAYCAIMSKQIAITLPFMLFALEWGFFKSRKRAIAVLGVAVFLGAIALGVILGTHASAIITSAANTGRWYYFTQQLYAWWVYAFYFLVPYFQSVDPHFTPINGLLDWRLLLAILLWGTLIFLALTKRLHLHFRIAIIWMMIIGAVENTFIPIKDEMALQRAYLLLPGFALIAAHALQRIPASALSYVILIYFAGSTVYQASAFSSAEKLWQHVAEKHPTNPRAQHNLGYYSELSGDITQAKFYFENALALDSTHHVSYTSLGYLALQQQQYEDAVSLFNKALMYNPKDAVALNNMGTAWRQLGVFEEALRFFRQSQRAHPYYPNPHYNEGVVLEKLNQLDAAKSAYQRAIVIKPAYLDAQYNLANLYLKVGKNDSALTHYREVLHQNPNHVDALNNVGVCFYGLQMPDSAIFYWQQILIQQPDNQSVIQNIEFVSKK